MNTRELQTLLNRYGYLCGRIDGVTGPKTRDAVRRFQASWNLGTALKVDGIVGPKTGAALAKLKANGGQISAHFKSVEFQCKCRGKYAGCPGIAVERADVAALEQLRAAAYPKGLVIVSALRCSRHNAAVGGAKASRHMVGDGFDVAAVVPVESSKIPARFTGRGKAKNGNARHLDSRPKPARWNY